MLEPEDMGLANEGEFLPEFNKFVQETFDCTKEDPVIKKNSEFPF